jgi:hypothetical protein
MPEKMTPERLELMLGRCSEPMRSALRAHLAALEAERNATLAQGQADHRAIHEALGWAHFWHNQSLPEPYRGVTVLVAERDAFRERVQALEKDVASVTAERDTLRVMGSPTRLEQSDPTDAPGLLDSLRRWRAGARAANARALAAESRLSAIRQRAGDVGGLLGAWEASNGSRFSIAQKLGAVARHIVKEDATGATVDGAREGPAHPEPEHDPSYAPEPSTVEAFVTVRMTDERIRNLCEQEPGLDQDDAEEVLSELKRARSSESLLERRVGAMGQGVRRLAEGLDRFPTPVGCSVETDTGAHEECPRCELDALREMAHAALTDAPRVFTLEEVRKVLEWYLGATSTEEALQRLAALRT